MAKGGDEGAKQKSHSFSIYLLKKDYSAENSLKKGHTLRAASAEELPKGAKLFILDTDAKPPWWVNYFKVSEKLQQEQKGAIVFFPVKERWFALSFGQALHQLDDNAFEYDFGLRVTLNSLDPNELKSADMVAPGASRRKRTQVPISTELTYLDFDGNSEIIKSLTGKVKPEYENLFRNATGSDSLRVSLRLKPNELAEVCCTLLELHLKKDYLTSFPNIQNILPERDPAEIEKLDAILIEAIKSNDERVTLTIPDIVDYRDNTCCVFQGLSHKSEIFPDISLEYFYEFFGSFENRKNINLGMLKELKLILTNVDGISSKSYSIYRSIFFDVDYEGGVFHLCEGRWFRVQKDYLIRLNDYLDKKYEQNDLCEYNHDDEKKGKTVYSEQNYNTGVQEWDQRFVCLDQTNISPSGETTIEPCDIYTIKNDPNCSNGYRGLLYHIKISTRSSQLSHLFNQGVNSVELIKMETDSRERIKQLLVDRIDSQYLVDYVSPIDKCHLKVVFGITTHKNNTEKSKNLPLFSRISLMRCMKVLDLYEVPSAFVFIPDNSPKKKGHQPYQEIIVEVHEDDRGRKELKPIPGQGYDQDRSVKRFSKDLLQSNKGTRYKMAVKEADDGGLQSHHKWPSEIVSQLAADESR